MIFSNKNKNSVNYKIESDKSIFKMLSFDEKNIETSLYCALLKNKDYDGTALCFRNYTVSFKNLFKNIDLYASNLFEQGVRLNTKVCLVLPNAPSTVYTIYALNKIGAKIFILHPKITCKGLDKNLKEFGAEFLITNDMLYNNFQLIEHKCKLLLLDTTQDFKLFEKRYVYSKLNKIENYPFDESLYLKLKTNLLTNFEVNKDGKKDSIFLGSGGTTGLPKIISLPDKAFNLTAHYCPYILRKQPQDIESTYMMALLPFFHGFGLAMGLHSPLYNRAGSTLFINFDKKSIVKMINKNRLNYIISVPYILKKLLSYKKFRQAKLKYLTHIFVGGSVSEFNLLTEMDELLKKHSSNGEIYEGYGLTEVTSVNLVNRFKEKKYMSVGKSLPFSDVIIVDYFTNEEIKNGFNSSTSNTNLDNQVNSLNLSNDNSFKILDKNEVGEICIESGAIMNTYLGETYQSVRENKNLFIKYNNKYYFKTGDLGYLDEDNFLFFAERKKNVYRIASFNIFPEEIIQIALSFKQVKEACTKLFKDKDKRYIYLYLEVEPYNQSEQLVLDIRRKIEANLIKYAHPYKIIMKSFLKRTPVGKVDISDLERE